MLLDWNSQPKIIRGTVLICAAIEGLALAATLIGFDTVARNGLLMLGGFWPDLLKGGSGLYPGQAITMFVTSAFIHGGPLHLFMNMVALMWLGPQIMARLGPRGLVPLSGLCALGAGLVFALMTNAPTPMVGASGILFGFLGALGAWEVADRVSRKQELGSLIQPALAFLALNVALTLLSGGSVAWTAHLGGFLAGLLCGVLTWSGPRRRAI